MMKKLLFISCLMLSGMNAMADDVNKVDASKVSSITFNGDKVIINYNDGTSAKTFDMAEVVLDFSSVTSIEERIAIAEKEGLEGKDVFNLSGQRVGNSVGALSKGIYIINGKKVIIK